MLVIQDMVARCAPWDPNDDEHKDHRDYLVSVLTARYEELNNNENNKNENKDENDNELFEIVHQFFDDPIASQKLVQLWKESLEITATYSDAAPIATSTPRPTIQQRTQTQTQTQTQTSKSLEPMARVRTDRSSLSSSSPLETEPETKPSSPNPSIRTKMTKKTKNRTTSKSKSKSKSKSNSNSNDENDDNNNNNNTNTNSVANVANVANNDRVDGRDLHGVVAGMQLASLRDLDETDDHAQAWQDAKNSGRAWGGRGSGGRGVNRGGATHHGRDAVVNGLTLAFSGRHGGGSSNSNSNSNSGNLLLQETHLVIAHGHRYGLWGKNGVGKSTLLRRIATGSVPGWPLHLSVALVEQEVLGTVRTVRECIRAIELDKRNSGSVRSNTTTTAVMNQNHDHDHDHDHRSALEAELAELESRLEDLADADADADANELEEVSERMSELYEQLEELERGESQSETNSDDAEQSPSGRDAFEGLEESAIAILRGLQFDGSMLDTPVRDLSGGWRMRIALAEALYSEPDVLLLDEPTNHLDASAIVFLEDYLVASEQQRQQRQRQRQPITLVVVSHDGHFLDAVCTDMILFENQRLEYHVGNYSTFMDRREQLWTKNKTIADATAKKEQKAREFIAKQKAMKNDKRRDDNKQRQAKERQKKLSRIGLYNDDGKRFKLLSAGKGCSGVNRASHIHGTYTNAAGFSSYLVDNSQKSFGEEQRRLLNFRFPSATPLKGATGEYAPLITMDDCRFRYDKSNNNPNDWVLRDVALSVSVGSRIAILGKNGAGKSTLLGLLSGELVPDARIGTLHRHANLRIAHVTQHHIEHLGDHLEQSPVRYFLTQHNAKNEFEARTFLGGFGLVGPLALRPIGTLSGGQKARLAFATVMYHAPHVLILDEPTNHLDGDSLESLAGAVDAFEGAVVTVSHHQDFLARVSREVWTIRNGIVRVETVAAPDANGTSDGTTTFADLYHRYKEDLRREAKATAKSNQKHNKCRRQGRARRQT